MAGFGAKGIINNRFISLNTLKENRGVSFAMGGVSFQTLSLFTSF